MLFAVAENLIFLSTHSKRSATGIKINKTVLTQISIHALQTECDISRPLSKLRIVYFYPRTPNGVRLMGEFSTPTNLGISIHALQTECDHSAKSNRICDSDFYPRTPNGVRHRCFLRSASVQAISIHALQTECDHIDKINNFLDERFLSTHSKRSATRGCKAYKGLEAFLSTHSKRSATYRYVSHRYL